VVALQFLPSYALFRSTGQNREAQRFAPEISHSPRVRAVDDDFGDTTRYRGNSVVRGAFTGQMRDMAIVDELSPDLVATVAARIDAAVFEAAGLYEVSVLLKLTDDEKSGPLGAVAMAFDYMLDTHGDEFGALKEWSDGRRYPPGLKDVPHTPTRSGHEFLQRTIRFTG
jgi:hypothetical protein